MSDRTVGRNGSHRWDDEFCTCGYPTVLCQECCKVVCVPLLLNGLRRKATSANFISLSESKDYRNMGWLSSSEWSTRQEMIDHVTIRRAADWRPIKDDVQYEAKLLRFCARGNVVWGVWELPWEIKDGRPVTLITCDLIQKFGKYEGFGYKDMDETVGPNYYTCPLSFLKLADNPPESKYSAEWRQAIIDAAKRKKEGQKSYKEGDFIIFEDDSPMYFGSHGYYWDFEVVSKKPLRFNSVGKFGFRCRLSKSAMSGKFRVVTADEYAKIRAERIEFRTKEAEKRRHKKEVFLS